MSLLAQELDKGLDLTVQPTWSGADANQLVDAGKPAAGRGLVLTTTDSGSTPDVPDASVDSASPIKKLIWQRYPWRRIRNSGLAPKFYIWNPNATSDATYLKWQEIGTSSDANLYTVTLISYAALRAFNFQTVVGSGISFVVTVLGYATAGDGGFGNFRYDPSDISSADDNGRVLVTTLSSYRFKRIVAIEEYAKPEWFGGLPSGVGLSGAQAMTIGCRKCVAYYNTLEFGPGVYEIDNKIIVRRYTRIRGAGKFATTVSVYGPSPAVAAHIGGTYYSVFMYCIVGTIGNVIVGETYLSLSDEGYCDYAELRDLSINGHYNSQTVDGSNRYITNVQAVTMIGLEVVVKSIAITKCGKGYQGGAGLTNECFIVRVGVENANSAYPVYGPIVEDVEISDIGRPLQAGATLASYGWPTNAAGNWGGLEVTCIAMSGSAIITSTPVICRIADCYIHDIPRRLNSTPNAINGIGIAGCLAAEVTGNSVLNVDGKAFYVDNTQYATQKTLSLNIHHNAFVNVLAGVWLQNGAASNQYKALRINQNIIRLYNSDMLPGWDLPIAPTGVMLFYSGAFAFAGTYPFDNIVVQGNTISGGGNFTPDSGAGTLPFYSRGIYCLFSNGDQFNGLQFVDNTIDCPQVGANSVTQTSGALGVSITYRIVTYVAGDNFSNVGCKDSSGAASNGFSGAVFVATGTTPTTYSNGSTLQTLYYEDNDSAADSLAIYFYSLGSYLSTSQGTGRYYRWRLSGNKTSAGKALYAEIVTSSFTRYSRVYGQETAREELVDPINLSLASGKITDLDYEFPAFKGQIWFNTINKRPWLSIDTKRPIASGALVEGRSYCVQLDDGSTGNVTYNAVVLGHNATFVALYGVTTYAATGLGRVYEHPDYCWQPVTRDAIQLFNASAATSYDILADRFIDSAFFVTFDSTDTDKIIYLPDPALYVGRSCYLAYGKAATASPREIQLSCKIAGALATNKIIDPQTNDYVTNLVISLARANLGPSGAAGTSLIGNIRIYSNGVAWFIASQVPSPSPILLERKGAAAGGDFVLTNDTVAPYYHNLSADPNLRQLRGLIYLEFSLTANVEARLPDPTLWLGYTFTLAIRVGNGFTVSVVGIAANTILNPGVTGVKGDIVTTAVVAAAAAAARIIRVDVTAMNGYWMILCN